MAKDAYIDLSASPSPSTSSSTHEDIDPTHSAGPARKRVRSQDLSSEERKEARAHRNRIAAQNSRDRRKAQFTYLERRVAELEEENRQLRAGASIPPITPDPRVEQNRARERENEELKERIRTLERGWDVVLKALATQGLPLGLPESTTSTNDGRSSSLTSEPSTFTPKSIPSAISPAPPHSSLEADSPVSYGAKEVSTHVGNESTRHLARVASIERPSLVSSVALQRVVPTSTPILPCPISSLQYVRRLQLNQVANHLSRPLPTSISRTAKTMTSLWRHCSQRLSHRLVPPSKRRRKAARYLLRVRSRRE
jgi:X box-binding protein 1